ncbi:MAG TPA: helix-turn-helix domain-containing protein [Phycisphaerae bacterium]|jgi:DNA-binding XRE family transcriptional regulator|nr:helix-turn-helix domain-containing protein [Phycisphaerae bacterium]HOB74741.1 helix-turn-helix domain-containing protein [Phycisphaerae bacterium]HOJ55255.1 helix-turn-helix domain-containing protein [Phycisphaerae bacterium]HOL27884.1 helix-turn-helix domain-containing protein [Phycisphaerae bacterium]HPP22333.1 helix-turn-helix domain-containing protein [Phycisphaerae bacterium]
MIRSEKEYREAVERIRQEKDRLAQQEAELKAMGLRPEEIKRALDPTRSFHQQLEEEVASYERLKRGEFDEIENFRGLGQLLVSLRIAQGLTQRQLAERLGVHETQVSRDERNEYHGITLERAAKILEALGVEIRSRVEHIAHTPAEVA